MLHFIHSAMRYFDRLDQHQWVLVFIVMVLFGAYCMRGFGSRSNY